MKITSIIIMMTSLKIPNETPMKTTYISKALKKI